MFFKAIHSHPFFIKFTAAARTVSRTFALRTIFHSSKGMILSTLLDDDTVSLRGASVGTIVRVWALFLFVISRPCCVHLAADDRTCTSGMKIPSARELGTPRPPPILAFSARKSLKYECTTNQDHVCVTSSVTACSYLSYLTFLRCTFVRSPSQA